LKKKQEGTALVTPMVRRDALGRRMMKKAKVATQHLRRTFHARGDCSGPDNHTGIDDKGVCDSGGGEGLPSDFSIRRSVLGLSVRVGSSAEQDFVSRAARVGSNYYEMKSKEELGKDEVWGKESEGGTYL
jgi:hypothetical protein